jgi:DNA-binding NtrC family response regulator
LFFLESKHDKEVETMHTTTIRGGVEEILLVDDDADFKQIMSQVLARLGYRVTAHTSSIEALAEFKANPAKFDLVLTDFDMPKMNGDQLVQKIMAVRPSMPAIINTGNSQSVSAEMVKALGIKGVLKKPATLSTLAAMIREVLDDSKVSPKGAFGLDA